MSIKESVAHHSIESTFKDFLLIFPYANAIFLSDYSLKVIINMVVKYMMKISCIDGIFGEF